MSVASPAYLTLSQVAARTGRHPELLRQWCAAGRIPCHRLGGSWVVLEADLPLLDRIATRGRRRLSDVPAPSGQRRVLAAVFTDQGSAAAAAAALRDRLALDDGAIETASLAMRTLPMLGLTVVAGRMPVESCLGARRILGAYGGRIVADLDDVPDAGPRRSAAARAATDGRADRTGRRRVSGGAQPAGDPSTSAALRPPKPNEVESTRR